jgi:hypothetical protein
MKHSLLLSSAALALIVGLTPTLAQDRHETKAKQDQTTSERQDRSNPPAPRAENHKNNAERRPSRSAEQTPADKETTGSRAAKSADSKDQADKGKANDSRKAANSGSDTKPDQAKTTDVNKQSPDERSAESKSDKKGSSPSSNAAAQKSNAARSKSAEQNESSPANKKKSTKTNDSDREAARANRDAKPKARVSASLDPHKKTELHSAIAKLEVKPVTHVNFSVSVGGVVPRAVSLRPLPSTIVKIVPQYRGYDFFVVRDQVVIVAPRTHKIVDVIERSRPSRARAESTSKHRLKLSEHQREIIRKHASSGRAVTTGSSATRTQSEVVIGETLPESVEIESFPDVVYREVPEIRTYRYIDRGGDIYLVDPSDRRVIEEIH